MNTHYRLFSSKESIKAHLKELQGRCQLKRLLQTPGFIGALFALALLPFVSVVFWINTQLRQLEEQAQCFEQVRWRGQHFAHSQRGHNEFAKHYSAADPDYLSHVVEEMTFLQPTIDALKVIDSHPSLQFCHEVQESLARLTKGENRLIFVEKKRQSSSLIEEVHYQQQAPIEVDGGDIKEILSAVEGVLLPPSERSLVRPQLVICCFRIKRGAFLGRGHYHLEMDVIRRTLKG